MDESKLHRYHVALMYYFTIIMAGTMDAVSSIKRTSSTVVIIPCYVVYNIANIKLYILKLLPLYDIQINSYACSKRMYMYKNIYYIGGGSRIDGLLYE